MMRRWLWALLLAAEFVSMGGCYDARAANRFSADNQTMTRTAAMPSAANLTVCCWEQIVVDRNAVSTIVDIDDVTNSTHFIIETGSDGTTINVNDGASVQVNATNQVVGSWYFFCGTKAGATFTYYISAANGGAITTGTGASTGTFGTWSSFRLNREEFSTSTFFSGRVAALKIWTAALTQAEVTQEQRHIRPVKYDNLYGWYPLWNLTATDKVVDFSGGGHPWTAGTATATENNPPVSY